MSYFFILCFCNELKRWQSQGSLYYEYAENGKSFHCKFFIVWQTTECLCVLVLSWCNIIVTSNNTACAQYKGSLLSFFCQTIYLIEVTFDTKMYFYFGPDKIHLFLLTEYRALVLYYTPTSFALNLFVDYGRLCCM